MSYITRTEALVRAIEGESQAGADARFDPPHEAICQEVAKLDLPSADAPDWERVLHLSHEVLGTRSKDLVVASYAAYAAYVLEGIRGLAPYLWLLAELAERYWDDAYPLKKRIRARVNAIDWLVDKLHVPLSEASAGPGDHQAVRDLSDAANHLRGVISNRFEDRAPSVRPLIDAIKRLELSLPSEAAPAPVAPEPPSSPPLVPQEAASAPQPEGAMSEGAAAPALDPASPVEDAPEASPLDALHAAIAGLVRPIREGESAGVDARYEPAHEAVQAEIAKLESPTAETPDWAAVRRGAESVLETQSKDILLAAYAAGAYHEMEGIAGLARGLLLVAEVLDRFWDDAFPKKKRMRARAGAVDWIVERAVSVADHSPTRDERAAVLSLEAAVKRLVEVCRARFEDPAPGTRPLQDATQRLVLSLPAEAPPPKPAPEPAKAAPEPPKATPAQSAPSESAASAPKVASPPRDAAQAPPAQGAAPAQAAKLPDAPAATLANPEEVVSYLKTLGESMIKAGRELFKTSSADPTGYRLTRLGLYLHMSAPPPVQSGRETAVPAPPGDLPTRLEAMANAGNWAALLEEAESSLPRMRFWVDLHRYVALALGGLGASHGLAREAVIQQTRHWLERMPDAKTLTFKGGVPFASPATLEWLDSEVMAQGEGSPAGAQGTSDGLDLSEARALVAKGKLEDAVAAFESAANATENRLHRFEARLACAEALSGSKPNVAEGIFRALADEADRYRIDDWHPKLAAACYSGWYKSLLTLGKGGKPIPTDLDAAFRRLCAVDALAALKTQ